MAYRHEILDQLQALKGDTTSLLGYRTEEPREARGEKARDIAADLKAFLSDIRDAIALEGKDVERAFAGRAAAALTTAQVPWRTERIIAGLRLKRLLTNLGLQALAALIAACGGVFLFEFAAYFALVQRWNAIWSAIALGLLNLGLAGLIVTLARRRPSARFRRGLTIGELTS